MIRTYSELITLPTLQERYEYLLLRGRVGRETFGHERWMNQQFYKSHEWRQVRNYVINRDQGCDLAFPGYEIFADLHIHHMNPMTPEDLIHGNEDIIDPEFLITTTLTTHNAIHYGTDRLLPRQIVERRPGDTKLW